jgi:hypothetical protein
MYMGGSSDASASSKSVKKAGKSAGSVIQKVGRSLSRSSSSSRSSGSSGRSSYSGGGSSGGGGYSGGGGGGGISKPKISIPSLAAYLGTDSAYQNALSGGKRTLADFISQLNQKRSQATTQYNTTAAGMERDRLQQLSDLRDEFASRGLIQSGLYGQEQGKFQQQFTDQRNALDQQQTSLLADLMSQQTNYKREQDLALQAAKQEAIQRRVAKYNIGA